MNSLGIAEEFKSLAETNVNNNSPGKAFAYYCLALEIRPSWLSALKSSFSTALCDWGKILEHEERYDELFSCYKKALILYPENELILNNLGAHLCRLQKPREALKYFKRAVEINNDYLPAYINTQVTKSMLVERWHFRMLNDSVRNESYRKAINKRVSRGCRSVLDIGSGTGILSIYGKAAGAEMVYGCDYSETMVSVSRDVLEDNGYPFHSIQVINKLSTDLAIPEDIPTRFSLVVTETFDGGLLGEHILETLIHAWENLLLPPSPQVPERVIPNGAVLYITPVECMHIARKNCIMKSNRIDRISFNTGLNLSQLCFSSKSEEPYDTENLKSVSCLYLSEPVKLFEFNFNNVSNLKDYYAGKIKKDITFQFKKKGYLDAFAVWFDLILDDEIVVTSSPLSEERCCWEQAIFPTKKEFRVNEESSVTIQASCNTGILSISPIQREPRNNAEKHVFVPESVISLLNSESLLLSLSRSFDVIEKLFGTKEMSALDLSVFPYLGALIAERMNSKVYCSNQIYDTPSDNQELLNSLKINTTNIVLLGWDDVLLLLKERKQTFEVIIADVMESSGQLSEEIVGMIPLLRSLLSTNGLFIPSKLQIWCQLVYSEELMNSSEVKSSTDHLHIAKHLNEYKVSQMIDFILHDTQYIEVSESFLIGSLDFQHATTEIILEKEIDNFKSFQLNAIIYWYNSNFFDNVEFSTFSSDSPINHAAALLDMPVNLEGVSKLNIKLQYNSGGMRFFVS